MATRPVFRIFISSTAIDLRDYRDRVRDAVLRLENMPIAMETFSAQSGQPVSDCRRMAADADAVICVVAHRYGYVPPSELGGDGERSITWLEVEAARRAGKPVFAFLVGPTAPWTQTKEQDRLVTEPPENSAEIIKAVGKLKEFKAYLERECTRQTFNSPDDLAAQVTAALANFQLQSRNAPASTARVWQALFCHALQPAQHFRGRANILRELKDWLQSPVTPDRVISIVAAGGTGKTALVHQGLHETPASGRAGIFVWSFYEDPHTDAFLRAAYLYFTGATDAPTAGMLERLQLILSGDAPHLLVLDGLERVQSEGGPRRRGELEDLQLKRLIRALAGGAGYTRALVTSRFPLIDLESWTSAGHRVIVLDDLEREIALDVLRAWGVKGDDHALTRLIEPLNIGGLYHALSVAVLGSYIGRFANGDPNRAPEMSLADASETDSKARRLHRILEQYAEKLTSRERDLLARLSLFPRGVKIELLGWIVQSGAEVAGALVGLSDVQLTRHLEELKNLGLVFRYETNRQIVYSAHPFLREFFRGLLLTKPEDVHESIRARLAPTLQARPVTNPTDAALLDQYEFLIEQTLLAGRVKEAFDLYWYALGSYTHLGAVGENVRGLRVLEGFILNEGYSRISQHLSASAELALLTALGLFAAYAGDLARARHALIRCRDLSTGQDPTDHENLAWLEMYAGHFRRTLEHSENAVAAARSDAHLANSLAARALARFALGEIAAATLDFEQSAKLDVHYSRRLVAILEPEHWYRLGNRAKALKRAMSFRENVTPSAMHVARADALLARLLLPDDAASAAQHLDGARAFANRSGDVDLQLRCFLAACELHQHLKNLPQAIADAEEGILLADTCGFGQYSIDLRIALAEALLGAGDPQRALQNARAALDKSEQPDCQYAWGKADGLHFCGLAHLSLGEKELALQRLTAALELREHLTHGRIDETRRALELVHNLSH